MPPRTGRVRVALAGLLVALATGCTHLPPQRPHVNLATGAAGDTDACRSVEVDKAQSTPEVGAGYVLHFVEFDDYGWTYPSVRADGVPATNAGDQLDCALRHIASELREGRKIGLYVYVHGWHHNAAFDDRDVERFRRVLKRYGDDTRDRTIVGLYVGWQGETIRTPVLNALTFLSRKNAAHRVADGRVRELFGRIKGLREYYNRNADGADCTSPRPSSTGDGCRMRAVMIGHSFGGLILYSAVQPYLLEALTAPRDRPDRQAQLEEPRSRGIADLVVLLNPAFEASMYEPIHRAAAAYPTGDTPLPPLLVSLTSDADEAVGTAFPIVRSVTTLFQRRANSELQAETLRDTVGNVDGYLTHFLCAAQGSCLRHPRRDTSVDRIPVCDMELHPLVRKGAPVWNVRTYKDVIRDHNDIMRDRTINFIEYTYALNVMGRLPCVRRDEADPISSLPAAEVRQRGRQ